MDGEPLALFRVHSDGAINTQQWLRIYATKVDIPEKALWLAALQHAIAEIARGGDGYEEDLRWLMSEDIEVGSFVWIWENLFGSEWSPQAARQLILGKADIRRNRRQRR